MTPYARTGDLPLVVLAASVIIIPLAARVSRRLRPGQRLSSTWNVLGGAVAGPLAGAKLEAVPFIDTFWFTRATFQPNTRVLRSEGQASRRETSRHQHLYDVMHAYYAHA